MGIFHKKPNVARLEAKRKLKALIKALNYKADWHIRKAAAAALGRIADPRAVELPGGQAAIVDRLKYMGLVGIATYDEVDSVREAATEALVRIGGPAVGALMGSLRSPGDLVSSANTVAAHILGEIGNPRAASVLVNALLRGVDTAPKALVKIGGAATPEICDAFQVRAGRVWHARARRYGAGLFEILHQVGDQRAVVPLLQYIKSGEREDDSALYPCLQEARMALHRIIERTGIEPLSAALREKYWIVRVAAVEELGKGSDSESAAFLREALTDEANEVREAAKRALKSVEQREERDGGSGG